MKLSRRIKLSNARLGFETPVAAHGAVYLSREDLEIIKLDAREFGIEWRQPSDVFTIIAVLDSLLVLARHENVAPPGDHA